MEMNRYNLNAPVKKNDKFEDRVKRYFDLDGRADLILTIILIIATCLLIPFLPAN